MMEHNKKERNPFVGYEYKEVTVEQAQASMYMDCYENFGWTPEENIPYAIARLKHHFGVTVRMKRDRNIINRMELTRLQQQFEACANEISILEKSKKKISSIWALSAGIIGTAFMAGSTFAVTQKPPIIWLCVMLALPGLAGWALPYYLYHFMLRKQAEKVQPLIEAKHNEIYEVCQKGHSLL